MIKMIQGTTEYCISLWRRSKNDQRLMYGGLNREVSEQQTQYMAVTGTQEEENSGGEEGNEGGEEEEAEAKYGLFKIIPRRLCGLQRSNER